MDEDLNLFITSQYICTRFMLNYTTAIKYLNRLFWIGIELRFIRHWDYTKTYLLTYSMKQSPSWEATWLQLVKKFSAFYGTQRFITALTSARHIILRLYEIFVLILDILLMTSTKCKVIYYISTPRSSYMFRCTARHHQGEITFFSLQTTCLFIQLLSVCLSVYGQYLP
jgi:hypothetical protein